MTRTLSAAAIALLAIALCSTPVTAAKRPTYVFVLSSVDPASGVTDAPTAAVRLGLQKAIDESPQIVAMLPKNAPNASTEPKKLKRFLKKKRLRAFRVNVEIIAYTMSEEAVEGGDKRVKSQISLRLFGETIPDRVMAFAGAGSATVTLDVGKAVRAVDEKAANREAINLAIRDAISASLKKLNTSKKKRRRRKRAK